MNTTDSVLRRSKVTTGGLVWFGFALAALLLLGTFDLTIWSVVVSGAALLLAFAVPVTRPSWRGSLDPRDLIAVAVLYLAVVVLFRVAFVVFTTANVLGLFLAFASALLLGVVGPIGYQVWGRRRDLRSLGLGVHGLGETALVGLALAAVQFSITLWRYELPEPVAWVPLAVMSLVVGFFEAVFFRGFIQQRLEASFGTAPGIAGAALSYGLYHVGYGMGAGEIWFLVGLGVVYAVAFRLVANALVLWPLLTPLGSFFNNMQAGGIELPWASIAGFSAVGIVMAASVWMAHRHIRGRITEAARGEPRAIQKVG
jgi:membrane protease YdiL (CAAX protease family)